MARNQITPSWFLHPWLRRGSLRVHYEETRNRMMMSFITFSTLERWSKELKGPHAWGRLIYSPIFEIFPKFVCFEIFTRLNFKSSTEITQHWKLQNLHISKYTNGKFKPKLNTYSWSKLKLHHLNNTKIKRYQIKS